MHRGVDTASCNAAIVIQVACRGVVLAQISSHVLTVLLLLFVGGRHCVLAIMKQMTDYAARKGQTLDECQRWLSPILNYDY
jgi:uncharacterized protein (DUF2342 family)